MDGKNAAGGNTHVQSNHEIRKVAAWKKKFYFGFI